MDVGNTLASLANDYVSLEICSTEDGYAYFLIDRQNNVLMADMDYNYAVKLKNAVKYTGLQSRKITQEENLIRISGAFEDCGISFEQIFEIRKDDRWLYESLWLKNTGAENLELEDINFGMRKMLFRQYEGWCEMLDQYKAFSVPTRRFRSQRVDRRMYQYEAADLVYPKWNASGNSAKEMPGYFDEAWIWAGAEGGIITCKYNREEIEYTRIQRQGLQLPGRGCENVAVLYGGMAIFDGNPEKGLVYPPSFEYRFGDTKYTAFRGGFEEGYYTYRKHLDGMGHVFPEGYNPPVHWNELYNLGWFAEKAMEGGHFSDNPNISLYTLEELYEEARIAREAGAESLYLDPGWDLYPGSCVWDEKRLGLFKDFVDKIHGEYRLKVALHLMMTFISNNEAGEFYCRNTDGSIDKDSLGLYRVCTNEVWVREKTNRLLKLVDDGVDFFMFDFPDYGNLKLEGCMDPSHGHEVPMRKQTHTENIMRVIHNVKKRNPKVLIEAHDRITGGITEYHALYYQHGGEYTFDENWGYEYMWNPLSDLVSGKALSLYEYNMACSIPLYLHINEHGDNNNMLALWWYASTTRHLGIGGVLPEEPKYSILKSAMALYHSLKEYFTRGLFYGLKTCEHLHVKCENRTAVLCVFNLSSQPVEKTIVIDCIKHGINVHRGESYDGTGAEIPAQCDRHGDVLCVKLRVEPLAAAIAVLR